MVVMSEATLCAVLSEIMLQVIVSETKVAENHHTYGAVRSRVADGA